MILNKEQLQVILENKYNLRIIAGAGTGKTRVITQKLIYLCKELSYVPERLLAITFTNKATNEMYERINQEISINKTSKKITIKRHNANDNDELLLIKKLVINTKK